MYQEIRNIGSSGNFWYVYHIYHEKKNFFSGIAVRQARRGLETITEPIWGQYSHHIESSQLARFYGGNIGSYVLARFQKNILKVTLPFEFDQDFEILFFFLEAMTS